MLEKKRTKKEQAKVDKDTAIITAEGKAGAKREAASAEAFRIEKEAKATAAGDLAKLRAQAKGFKQVANAIGQQNMKTYLTTDKWKGEVPLVDGGGGTIVDLRGIAPIATTPAPK